jgi:4-hydroxy-2-oxoheptanedioate aldolase
MNLRATLENGTATVGGWCRIPSGFSLEVVARSGFDWVCIDTQHGLAGQESMVSMLQAADACAVPALVRVSWNEPDLIMRALDAGAQGVIVPGVNYRADAERAAGASHYPPVGFRSWGPNRASLGRPDYTAQSANVDVVCLVMIETPEAVENVEEILNVPGVGGAYIGPSDLAVASGFPYHETETLEPTIQAIRASCERLNLIAGIHCSDAKAAERRGHEGFQMMAVANDQTLLGAGAAAAVRAFRSASAPPSRTERSTA